MTSRLAMGVVMGISMMSQLQADVLSGQPVSIEGELNAKWNISALSAAAVGQVWIAGDELTPSVGNSVQRLSSQGHDRYRVSATISLKPLDEEMDIEALAVSGKHLYVLGSHALKRKRVKDHKSLEKNRKRLTESGLRVEHARDQLVRLSLDSEGQVTRYQSLSLRPVLEQHPQLKPYLAIPSKENGVDMEGLAVKGKQVWVGFRGPVFRDGWVPVLKLRFKKPDQQHLMYVPLQGLGIRDLVAVDDGFLILAGPMGETSGPYRVYWWNGVDCLPDKGREQGKVALLGDLATPLGGKAEGLTVMHESVDGYAALIAFDGLENGAMQRYVLPRSSRP